MNREVHVRIWERPAVRILRATRRLRRFHELRGGATLEAGPLRLWPRHSLVRPDAPAAEERYETLDPRFRENSSSTGQPKGFTLPLNLNFTGFLLTRADPELLATAAPQL